MAPEWRYSDENGGMFMAYADAKGSASQRRFHASNGAFIEGDARPSARF